MQSQLHYLPLAPGFFAILVAFFFIVLIARRLQSFMLSRHAARSARRRQFIAALGSAPGNGRR
jgi:uncharacterized membrane protein